MILSQQLVQQYSNETFDFLLARYCTCSATLSGFAAAAGVENNATCAHYFTNLRSVRAKSYQDSIVNTSDMYVCMYIFDQVIVG